MRTVTDAQRRAPRAPTCPSVNSHHRRLETPVQVIRVTTDLTVPDIDEAKAFYTDYLGLEAQEMGLDWVTRFVVPGSGEHIQLVSR
ncbi:MAG: VOC family protein, partial [Acidimicrobiales bacterium]